MSKPLCELKSLLKNDLKSYAKLVRGPTHICRKCGRRRQWQEAPLQASEDGELRDQPMFESTPVRRNVVAGLLRRRLLLALLAMLFPGSVRAETNSWLFLSLLREKKIVTFARDAETGVLTRRGETKCPAEPACLSVSPDRRTLFASFRSTGQLASFNIESASGELKQRSVVSGGGDPAYLLPDRSGRFLLSAYYQANKVTVHKLASDGSISEQPWQTIPTAEKAHGIALDRENRVAFVPHTAANRIYQFHFRADVGKLRPSDPAFVAALAEEHPRHIALHPTDRWAYVSNEAGDSIGVFTVDRKAGTLRRLQTMGTLPVDFDGSKNATARCEMTPDGRFIYVANRGHDSIAGFAIDPKTGKVRTLGRFVTEKTPRSFTIDPKGRFLYAAGQGSGRIAAFRIEANGELKRFATYTSGPVSWWVLAVDSPRTKD